MYANLLVNSRRKFVAVFAGKYFYADNFTCFAMRNTQRAVAYFACFFAEDGAQQAFFCGKFGFAFRSYLADEDIARAYFRTNADNSAFVKVFQCFFRYVRNIAGNFFFTKFGVAGIAVVFFNMNGSKYVGLYQIFTQKNSIFVVVAFPRHVGNYYVVAKCKLAMVGCRAVCQYLAFNNLVALVNNRALVNAGTLVGAFKFQYAVFIYAAVIFADNDFIAGNAFYNTSIFSQNAYAGVNGNFIFHTSTDDRSLSAQKRHCLTLHVGTHKSTVRVIVFEERNKCGSDRYNLFRRNVHEVYLVRRQGKHFVLVTCGYTFAFKVTFVIQRFVRLSDNVIIFFISGKINNFISYALVFFINTAVRGFHKAVFVNNSKGRKRTDKADVRTFRGFNRAHTAIVGMVYVADFIACTFTAQATGAQCGKTAFMGQLGQRVVLVHKLGELAAAKEFFNCSNNRADINKRLRSDNINVLNGHAFFYNAFHTGKADAELVLQKFADTAYTAVAQMVDIIAGAKAVHQVQQITEGSHYIFNGNGAVVFRNIGSADDFHRLFFQADENFFQAGACKNTAFFDFINNIKVNLGACFSNNFTGRYINQRLIQHFIQQTAAPAEFFVQLIAAYAGKVITFVIKEGCFNKCRGVFQSRRFARTQLFINFN